MKFIKFKKFLEKNSIALHSLPKPIEEKAEVFEQLYEILEKVDDPDYEELVEQLEILDLEILQDIEEFLEDRLENNEPLEVLAKSAKVPKPIQKKAVKRLTTDESIIAELVKMGRIRNISRSTLIDLGFKMPLKNGLVVGKYALKRTSIFLYRYDIVELQSNGN